MFSLSSITSDLLRAFLTAFVKSALLIMILCVAAGVCFPVMNFVTGDGVADAGLSVGDKQDVVLDGAEVLNGDVQQYLSFVVILKPIVEHVFSLSQNTFDIQRFLSLEFFADLAVIELSCAVILLPILRFTSYINERMKNSSRLQKVGIMVLFDFILYLIVIVGGTACTGMIHHTLSYLMASLSPVARILLSLGGILVLSFLNALFHKKFLTHKKFVERLGSLFITFAMDVLVDLLYTVAVAFTVVVLFLIFEYQDAMLAAGDMTIFGLWAALFACAFLIPWSCFLVFKKSKKS